MATAALSTKPVGSVIKTNINGTLKDFVIVHQGRPSTLYDESCNGTWLMLKDIYEMKVWNNTLSNKYETSSIDTWLNSTFFDLLDADVQEIIKQVKIPYRSNGGLGTTQTGENGLSRKVFLLSGYEIGLSQGNNEYIPIDGSKLDYFTTGTSSSANSIRIAKFNNTATSWAIRSMTTSNDSNVWSITSVGSYGMSPSTSSFGARPTFIVPSNTNVDDDDVITINKAPSTPSTINIPNSILSGTTITISWAASTDDDNSPLAGYILERSINAGVSWGQIYKGPETSTTMLVTTDMNYLTFRVKAYDTENAESDYQTSLTVTVQKNTAPSAPASITIPDAIAELEEYNITWGESSDTDNNFSGYRLERKIDSSEWEMVYNGASTSYTDTAETTWTTVKYRVCAYDTQNYASAYIESDTVTISHNILPSAPSSITIGDIVVNKNITITWGAATDSDGTIVSYVLERCVNETDYEEVYNGPLLTYSETASSEWATVSYRVKAVDNKGGESTYKESDTKIVQEGKLYIAGPLNDMGEQTKSFDFKFEVKVTGDSTPYLLDILVTLNGYEKFYTDVGYTNTEYSVPIDIRSGKSGNNIIKVQVISSGFISDIQEYQYTIQPIPFPDGGTVVTFEDNLGSPIFPQTVASAILTDRGQVLSDIIHDLQIAIDGGFVEIETNVPVVTRLSNSLYGLIIDNFE